MIKLIVFAALMVGILGLDANTEASSVGIGLSMAPMHLGTVRPNESFVAHAHVQNTGDVSYDAVAEATCFDDVRCPARWVSFEPRLFHLEPGQAISVTVTVYLHRKTVPGFYQGLLEFRATGFYVSPAVATYVDLCLKEC